MMKIRHFPIAAAIALAIAAPSSTWANVYAAELSATNAGATFDISFRLNEDADAVNIEIVNNVSTVIRTINAGALAKGLRTVSWDKTTDGVNPAPTGTYTFRVVASKTTGYADWTKISDDASPQTQFFSPRGLAINKNQSSPLFGRIYVTENAGNVAGGRSTGTAGTGDGIFVLSNDFADITTQGNVAYGSAAGFPASTAGPYALALSDDGFLYIGDWTDTNADIWVMQESNLSAAPTRLFGSETRSGIGVRNNGVADYHGSIASIGVFGTGASKYLLTTDEDITVAGANPGSILRYDIGNTTSGYNTTPTVVYDDTVNGNLVQNAENGFVFDAAGNIWISQFRSTDSATVPSLFRYNTTTNAVDFNSGSTAPGPFNASNRGRIAIDLTRNRLALSGSAAIRILDISTFPPTVAKTIGTPEGYSGTNTYMVAFDPAGNVYSVNASAERLRAFSPPGPNSFSTSSPTGVSLVIGSSVENWNLY